ncbi:MAG: hypothetical protein AAF206_19085 [Bacteroidota bacterium]
MDSEEVEQQCRISFNIIDVFNALEAIEKAERPAENILISRSFDFSQRTF